MFWPSGKAFQRKSQALLAVGTLLVGLAIPVVWQARSILGSITVSAAPENSDPTHVVTSLTVRFQPGVHAYRGASVPGADYIHGVKITLGHSYRDNIETLTFSKPLLFADAARIGDILKKAGVVEFADVMLPLQESDADPLEATCTDTGVGTDSCRTNQDWWMNQIGAYTAWTDTAANASGVTVAVLDTGKRDHPDMTTTTSQWVAGYDMIGLSRALWFGIYTDLESGLYTSAGDSNGRDADTTDEGNGRNGSTCHVATEIIVGPTGPYASAGAVASSWHGTKVAGIIAAQTGNGIGLSGVAPNVKIQPVRVLGKCLESDDGNNLPDGIDWASGEQVGVLPLNTANVKVINMSLGALYPPSSQCPTVYQLAIDRALAKGIIVVAAAGNDFRQDARRNFPSGCAGVISVGATNRENLLATYSNIDADLSAPGGELGSDNTKKILMLSNSGAIDAATNVYKYGQGTSMSSPMVAAAAAMARTKYPFSAYPTHTPAVIKSAFQYAASLGTQCTGCGSGILNIPTFLGVLSPTAQPSVALNTAVNPGWRFSSQVTWSAPISAAWNPITSYSVAMRTSTGTLVDTCTKTGIETLACDFTISQNTQYTVAVTAIRGSTSSTPPVTTFTTRRQSPAPSGLVATPTTTSATFSWTEPTDLGSDTLGSLAEVQVFSSENGDTSVTTCYANESPCESTNLQAGTTYWAAVSRWAQFYGSTQTSPRVRFTTTSIYVAPTTTTIPSVTTTLAPNVITTTTLAPNVITTTTVAPRVTTTTTIAPTGTGASSPSASSSATLSPQILALKTGATATKSKLLSLAKLTTPTGSKYVLSVDTSSKKVCKVVGTSIKTLKAGTCSITVSVTLKGQKAIPRSVKLKVS